ncbi:hypothetical protein BC673_10721 [Prevotella pallens]|uniref:Uncharacterized protein n=1 Tax=Prevotella pallens TaxID=60133 RepID=A0ABX9DUL4_9BACT|nr:hypothetical protein BC673_10721 [Prevotella pallens]
MKDFINLYILVENNSRNNNNRLIKYGNYL